jgi:hypothetical protein
MKKFVTACVLALPLAAATQQQASAGCEFHASGGWNISFVSTGSCFQWSCCSMSVPGGGCDPYAGMYGYPYGVYGAPIAVGQPATTPPAPSAAPVQKTSYPAINSGAWGFQPVGYFQAPSYWYGQ